MNEVKISKFLSLVLRHQPEQIGLVLDQNGWASIDELIALANVRGTNLSRPQIQSIVENSDKQRFAISADGMKIRANQGHSVDIALGLAPHTPPEQLFHGTATRFLDSIREIGLHSASRQHVHLSSDRATAEKVGSRHGNPVILTVETGQMARDGRLFYVSENGVWLTDAVPAQYLQLPDTD
ncbi:RNA 2'-phosphotransferase [Duganella sp. Root1480D1]|uniref:RNA 2'-phosphotransferase n=1 Tax=Duganella sp. Root1480D1 TaxID=1736471 RepID=UPI00070BB766|nr:RNA 2'-phosphotransferase [Duganella sp. Root1480D1]KQZ26238.1 RNA 2'-phosphotransferase [Duganella sp. Root1480D1]